jgi:hypothetical protein
MIVGGMTPTAGGVVFFGDMAGNSMRSMPPPARNSGARSSANRRRRDHLYRELAQKISDVESGARAE